MRELSFLLERDLIIALALGGAFIATGGSYLVHRKASVDPKLARFVLRFGYALSFFSVGLFIIAGFVGAGGGN